MRARALFVVAAMLVAATMSCTPAREPEVPSRGLVGSWKLVSLEESTRGGDTHAADATGSLVLTPDGRMSVQVMYRGTESPASNAPVNYAVAGYEATFGRYVVDEPGHRFTFHVEGALVRTLVGKHLTRHYELASNRLVVTPVAPDEHWRVTWERP